MIRYFSSASGITFIDNNIMKSVSVTDLLYEHAYSLKDTAKSLSDIFGDISTEKKASKKDVIFEDGDFVMKVYNGFIDINGDKYSNSDVATHIKDTIEGLSSDEIAVALENVISFFKKAWNKANKCVSLSKWIENSFFIDEIANGKIYRKITVDLISAVKNAPINFYEKFDTSLTKYYVNQFVEIDPDNIDVETGKVSNYNVLESSIIRYNTFGLSNDLSTALLKYFNGVIDASFVVDAILEEYNSDENMKYANATKVVELIESSKSEYYAREFEILDYCFGCEQKRKSYEEF